MMGVQIVLVVLILCAVTLGAQGDSKGDVQFKQNTVTLTCPEGYTKRGPGLKNDDNNTYTFEYKKPVKYYCESGSKKYFFYVKGKGCDNCFELEGWLLAAAIVGDVVMTTILIMIIYKCNKKKTTDEPAQTIFPSAPPANYPPGPRGRHAPSQTYEPLNPQTRHDGVYSKVQRTG
ncbi:T-cell surface glycoprotein CD3 epsilon chain isoform X1 [Oryzias melastigma]|uniref:CD3e molecule n=1 Tax=Oryzias melastigma TaxID=30732 RepID=A0A3B3BHW7_ORYME|nr:T-cell surface glycoprotein CD3 epsilon chain isoform X1 [Oryzias melastigma]